jgi:hypothetical protein
MGMSPCDQSHLLRAWLKFQGDGLSPYMLTAQHSPTSVIDLSSCVIAGTGFYKSFLSYGKGYWNYLMLDKL